MNKFSKSLKALSNTLEILKLPIAKKNVTFYSEGTSYWPHLENILYQILNKSDLTVLYLSSDINEPVFKIDHPRLRCLYIGQSYIRDFVFQTINTKIMILTMPDLNRFSVKRSRFEVHYIYVQHSLVSLHMVYRFGAFDHFDTICCAGPHHVKEIKAIEREYNLRKKNIIKHGYSRLDFLSKMRGNISRSDINERVLIAPSWGSSGLIESGLASKIIDDLLKNNFKVILRPHPQTLKLFNNKLQQLLNLYEDQDNFVYEIDMEKTSSFNECDIMVSDWSGVALEFAFAFYKPVVFCDIDKKINNIKYQDLLLKPLEIVIRDQIGTIWDCNSSIIDSIKRCTKVSKSQIEELKRKYLFNHDKSDEVFLDEVKRLFKKL